MDGKGLRNPLPYPWDALATVFTPPLDHMVGEDVVPSPDDEGLFARRAIGVFPGIAGHVPYIDIFKADGQGHCPSLLQGLYRCRGKIAQLIERIKTGKMERYIRSDLILDPETHLFHHLQCIVLGGDHEVNELHVNPLVPQLLDGVENRLETALAHLPIECIGKALEVDAGSAEIPGKVVQGLRIDIAVGVADAQDPIPLGQD
jgi:hypothetical protein